MFEDLKRLMRNIVEDTKTAAEELGEMIDDFSNDIQVINQEFKEDMTDLVVNEAYSVSFELGQFVEGTNQVGQVLDNVNETLGNALHTYRGKRLSGLPSLADHLYVPGHLDVYTHHGIYIGNGRVIHYGLMSDSVLVHEVSLKDFSNGKPIFVLAKKDSPIRHTPQEAVDRAISKVGESEYNLLYNNCENFVRWCRFES